MNEIIFSEAQKHKILHMCGVDQNGIFYDRNYYSTGRRDDDLDPLVDAGVLQKRKSCFDEVNDSYIYFAVNKIELLKILLSAQIYQCKFVSPNEDIKFGFTSIVCRRVEEALDVYAQHSFSKNEGFQEMPGEDWENTIILVQYEDGTTEKFCVHLDLIPHFSFILLSQKAKEEQNAQPR